MASETVDGSTIADKYADFDITHVNYKHVNGTPIPASILVSKGMKAGKKPVLLRWHGGCFMIGTRLTPEWFSGWLLALGQRHDAILISPDYRLLPEAKGSDILDDIRDFLAWLFAPGALAQHLPDGVEPDLERVLVAGESAGGWLALQSGLLEPTKLRAVISLYPMVDLRAPYWTAAYEKQLFSPPVPQMPARPLDAHLAGLGGGEVVTGRGLDSFPLVVVAVQSGRFGGFFGPEPELYPLEVLERVGGRLPPTWVVHGEADAVVPVEGTRKFVDAFKAKLPETPLLVTLLEDEDHGFDNHSAALGGAPVTLETEWVKSGVEFIEKLWPA